MGRSHQIDPTVFFVVPTRNRADLLEKFLISATTQTYPHIKIIIVDDGSTDQTSKVLAQYKSFKILKGDGNLWWTGATNKGIKYVLKHANSKDFVLTINDDTQFKSDYVHTLVSTSQKHHRAIVGSVGFASQKLQKPIETGRICNWHTHGGFALKQPLPKNWKTQPPKPVDTLSGKGVLIPIEVFQKIGFYSKHLPHYGADMEFVLRAKKTGFPVLLSYQALVYNTSKDGGGKLPSAKLSWVQVIKKLFSKGSKTNLKIQFTYLFLTTPPKYRLRPVTSILQQALITITSASPFFEIKKSLKTFLHSSKSDQ